VRLEVESGLRNAQLVIPVLVDGAEMPAREELPASIAELATHNAFRLSWHEEVGDIGRQVAKVERERAAREAAELAERERLDLTRGSRVPPHSWRSTTATASFNVAIKAMELSLERQGRSVRLASADFWQAMEKLSGRPPDQGFLFDDLVHVIDFVGVKARRGAARYVARSYPVESLDEAVEQLALGRPVLTGLLITDRWFEEPAATTGRVDLADPGSVQGGTLGAIVAWDPRLEELRLLTPWPTWGDRGEATLARASAERALTLDEMRSIEAVEMPMRSDG
jgi:hypothetical protein